MTRAQKLDLLKQSQLYGIIDTGYVSLEKLEITTDTMCKAGVRVLQLRAKDLTPEAILPLAGQIKEICKAYGCLFVVNDHPEVAKAVSADALHIGQEDGSLKSVREVIGDEMLVGRSTHSLSQALEAKIEGADYIGFGPLFPTPTKKGRASIGLNDVANINNQVGSSIPVFCIGGIKFSNLTEVLSAGAQHIVIVSDILTAPCIDTHVKQILSMLDKSLC